jgi:hypothetical protein
MLGAARPQAPLARALRGPLQPAPRGQRGDAPLLAPFGNPLGRRVLGLVGREGGRRGFGLWVAGGSSEEVDGGGVLGGGVLGAARPQVPLARACAAPAACAKGGKPRRRPRCGRRGAAASRSAAAAFGRCAATCPLWQPPGAARFGAWLAGGWAPRAGAEVGGGGRGYPRWPSQVAVREEPDRLLSKGPALLGDDASL